MGGGGGGGGGGRDRNRGIERGRTKQAKVGVSKSVSVDVGEKSLVTKAASVTAKPVEAKKMAQPKVSTPAKPAQPVPKAKPAEPVIKAVPVPKAKPAQPAPKPVEAKKMGSVTTATPTKLETKVGFGTEVIDTAAAQAQLSARQKDIMDSPLSKVPSVGGLAASLMGQASLAAQKKALEQGGVAVAVPGTSFAPQGQAYTEAPGMRSSAQLAGQRFKVGQTFSAKSGEDIKVITMDGIKTQKAPSQYTTGPAGSIGKISATKPSAGSGMGYVGDVAGVVKTKEILGVPVTTFTGKTGYSPTGEKMAEPTGGGKETPTVPVAEPEVTPEVTPEIVPDDTILASKTRRTRFKRAGQGGTILEGFGALYK